MGKEAKEDQTTLTDQMAIMCSDIKIITGEIIHKTTEAEILVSKTVDLIREIGLGKQCYVLGVVPTDIL